METPRPPTQKPGGCDPPRIDAYGSSNVVMHFCFSVRQDPMKEGEAKIKADYEELYEEMATQFRNLED